jgi:hypothetical protein
MEVGNVERENIYKKNCIFAVIVLSLGTEKQVFDKNPITESVP